MLIGISTADPQHYADNPPDQAAQGASGALGKHDQKPGKRPKNPELDPVANRTHDETASRAAGLEPDGATVG